MCININSIKLKKTGGSVLAHSTREQSFSKFLNFQWSLDDLKYDLNNETALLEASMFHNNLCDTLCLPNLCGFAKNVLLNSSYKSANMDFYQKRVKK